MDLIKNTFIYYGISILEYLGRFEKNTYIKYVPYRSITFKALIPVRKIADDLDNLVDDNVDYTYIEGNITTACCLYWFFNGTYTFDEESIKRFAEENELDIEKVRDELNLIIIDDLEYTLISDNEEEYFYEQLIDHSH